MILAILIVLFVFADHLKHVEIVPTTWYLVIALLGGFATLHNIRFLL